MNSEQALSLIAQIINQTKFTLAEGDSVRQAFQLLSELVQKDVQGKPELQPPTKEK